MGDKELISDELESKTREERMEMERAARGIVAGRLDSPLGFENFYFVIYGNELPVHGKRWIEKVYEAKGKDKGALIWGFRGSWKSTILSIAFTAFRIGHNPERSNVVIQAGDDSAVKTGKAIADIIEQNAGWKLCFANVIPDKEKGWGETGWEVKLADVEYGEWRSRNAARRDPTLFTAGYSSRALIGKHPSGVLLMDDIHDESNTVSAKERQSVIDRVKGTILPMVIEDEREKAGSRLVTWEIVVGTPWNEGDVYHYLRDTGEFEFASYPVMEAMPYGSEGKDVVEIGEEDMAHAVHTDIVGNWRLNWAGRFNKKAIVSWRNKTGKREFARMYLLDLTASNETGLKYFSYPSERIESGYPMYGGVDYASVIEKRKGDDPGRDYFAMAYIAKLPRGGAVIVDGVFEQVTQSQGEVMLNRAQGLWPNWGYSVVEGDGKGEEFISVVMRNPVLRIVPMKTHGKGKKARLEHQLGPWLESGQIRISDAETPFLNALRKALTEYPNWHLDPIDAVYWACRAVQDVLVSVNGDNIIEEDVYSRYKHKSNPFAELARA